MKAFVFSLQKVLDVKSARERSAEESLARAIRAADETRAAIGALQRELRKHVTELENARGSSGGSHRLRASLRYLDDVHERMDRESACLLKQEQTVEELRAKLNAAIRERKSMERLSEGERKEWREAVRRLEQGQTDEAAVVTFSRRRPVDARD